jgi:hypothetical protein
VKKRKPDLPIWDEEAIARVLGARDGYVAALIDVEQMIARFDGPYRGRFNPRHVRKIAERDAITAPLRELAKYFRDGMNSCQTAYDRERARRDALASTPQPIERRP